MISRRKTPDGQPFPLYCREGKSTVSYDDKLPSGKWAFRLSAHCRHESRPSLEAGRRADFA